MGNIIKAGLLAAFLTTQLNAVETTTIPLPQPEQIIPTTVVAPQQVAPSVLSIIKSGTTGVGLLISSIGIAAVTSIGYRTQWDGMKGLVEDYPKISTGIFSISAVALFTSGILNIVDMVKKIQLRRQLSKA